MNKINIFLDDIRVPSMSHNIGKGLGESFSDIDRWIIVRDYFEFEKIVSDRFDDINIISFDHDLSCFKDNMEYTGKTAADYLVDFCLDNNKKLPNWYVHTDNTSGRRNIIGLFLSYLKSVQNLDISKFKYYHSGLINGLLV